MPLPIQNAQAQSILQMLAGGGAPGGASPGGAPGGAPAGGPPPSPTGMALQGATQQLDGANPQGIMTMVQSMSDALAQLYLMSAMRMPSISDDVAQMRKYAGKIIEKAQKAQQVLGGVTPIMNSAGVGPQQNPMAGAGSPDISSLLSQ